MRIHSNLINRKLFVVAPMAVLAGLLLLSACTKQPEKKPAALSVPVTVAPVMQKDVPLQIKAIGTVEPYNNVQVKTQVTGQLMSVNFKEGQDVKKGDLLFVLDRRPLEADLRKAEATLAKDVATAENDRAQAKRYAALLKEGVVAQQQTDQMQTIANASEALANADRAAVENAKVQLTYTRIYSPIDGRTGNLLVQEGNMVKANDTTPLVVINQIAPIYVGFTIPEQFLGDLKKYMVGSKNMKIEALFSDAASAPAVGKLSFVDNAVDRQTGTIKLKGTFDNADRRLWPGQFVNVVLTLATQPKMIVVPAQAVQTGQQGQYVFVVKEDMTAEKRDVTVLRTNETEAVIATGLKTGETVVTDGQLRITPKAKLDIKDASASPSAANGTPGK